MGNTWFRDSGGNNLLIDNGEICSVQKWTEDGRAGPAEESKAPDGSMAVVVVQTRRTGEALRYPISDQRRPKTEDTKLDQSDPSVR